MPAGDDARLHRHGSRASSAHVDAFHHRRLSEDRAYYSRSSPRARPGASRACRGEPQETAHRNASEYRLRTMRVSIPTIRRSKTWRLQRGKIS